MKTLGYKQVVLTPLFIAAVFLMFLSEIEAKSPVQIKADIEISVGRERSVIVKPLEDFRIDIWTNRPSYYAGEDIRIYFHATRDCYVYIFDIDTYGTTRQIFPNYFDQDNFIRGGSTYSIPDYGYHLEVSGPPGTEYLRILGMREHHLFLRDYERFDRSDPFPRHPGGLESFRKKLESRGSETEIPGKITPRQGEERNLEAEAPVRESPDAQVREGRMAIIPRPDRPMPPYRDYAESYTSFSVRSRWYEPDEEYRTPMQTRKFLFRSIPDDAMLYIDGVFYGKTSQKVKLTFGPHRVRMRKPGFFDWVRSIYVDENTDSSIAANMIRSRHDYWEPYREEWDWEYKDLDRERMERGRWQERSEINAPGLKRKATPPGRSSPPSPDSISTRQEEKLRDSEVLSPQQSEKQEQE